MSFLLVVLALVFALYNFGFDFFGENDENTVILENPLRGLILANTNANNEVDIDKVISQGVLEFNSGYITYMLVALGTGELHKSVVHNENPLIEIKLDSEIWNSEIVRGSPKTSIGGIENEDIRIISSKEEIVKIILAENKEEAIKNVANAGNLNMEIVAGETELFAKGYLKMYEKFKK